VDVDIATILDSLGTARRFADPEAPLAGRKLAAGGALPLPPEQIAQVLFCLTFDPEPEVGQKAGESLDNLPAAVIDVALASPVHGGLLARLAERFRDDGPRIEKIALNAATADDTYCFLATLPHPRVIDIVSRNQTRLLRSPDLVEALSENPVVSGATIDRVLEFLGIHGDDPGAAAETSEAADVSAPEPEAGTATAGAAAFDPDDASGLPEELVTDDENLAEADEEKQVSLYSQIQKMNVLEKIKLGRFGNVDARSLLVRDSNKIVATAAIRSPKIKESEVVTYAQSRNLAEEVLRIIATNREWTKSYQVKRALVGNPKVPLTSAIKFINYLTDQDLKGLMRSREVPAQIAVQAKRILARKGKT
jgi:hypothetical protein